MMMMLIPRTASSSTPTALSRPDSLLAAIFSVSLGRVAAELDARIVSYDYKKNVRAPWPKEFHAAIQALELSVGNTVPIHTASHKDAKAHSH